ncbi:periplasmic heavy metal sensor [Marinilabiliaceae bacterium JC017]|nr:periplasmic heavy metal sensor [Marinilabiliaceae bacterium JC017]
MGELYLIVNGNVMKRRVKIQNLVLVMLILALPGTMIVQAKKQMGERPGKPVACMPVERAHGERMADMNLTDIQKEQIQQLKIDYYKQVLPFKNELNEKKARLKTLASAESVNFKSIEKVLKEESGLHEKIQKAKIRHLREVRSVLNEEQRVLFDTRGHEMRKGKMQDAHSMKMHGNRDRKHVQGKRMKKHQGREQHKHKHPMGFEDLQLTDEQQAQVKQEHLKLMKEVALLTNQVAEKRARLRTLSARDNADLQAMDKVVDEMGQFQFDIALLKAKSRQHIRSILTDDQRVLYDMRKGKKDGRWHCPKYLGA